MSWSVFTLFSTDFMGFNVTVLNPTEHLFKDVWDWTILGLKIVQKNVYAKINVQVAG